MLVVARVVSFNGVLIPELGVLVANVSSAHQVASSPGIV